MRRIPLVAVAAAASIVLAGCGEDDGDGSQAGASNEVEVFTWWSEGGEKAGLDGLVQVFEQQYPDQTFVNGVVAGGAGSNAKNVLASRLEQGDPPSTFQGHAGGELRDYIAQEQIQDVGHLYEEEGWNDVFPEEVVSLLTEDDAIYSVPANIHRANVVWANPHVLKNAGVSQPPDSIDAWLEDLQALQDNGVKAPLAVATDWTQVHLFETVLIADLGPEAYNGLWTGETAWDSAEVTRAIEDYAALMEFTNGDRAGLDWPDSNQYMISGRAAYTVMGDWSYAGFEEAKLKPQKEYIWFPVPGTDGVFDFLADSFTLPVDAPNAEGTENWLRTVGSAEGQEAFNTKKGSIPVRTDADPQAYGEYQQEAMQDWQSDTIVPSLAHGAAAPLGWLEEITSAIGEFSSSKDTGKLQEALVAAAETYTGSG
ncbi:MAG: extracellular solute-binding protein [Propionibacteriales bacterium]|nr:extracellular solute-binding protein [Propionibacteriales bacterium]